LERISEVNRLTEEELEALTARLLPGIYGALLDLLVTALRNLSTTKPAKLPRLADFARLCIAAEILGFLEAYTTNLETGCQAAVEANPVAEGILALLDVHNGYWKGSCTELVRQLQELDPTSREFQRLSAHSVGKRLASSLKGDLAAVGVSVKHGRGAGGQRYVILESQKTMAQPSQTPTPARNNGATAAPASPGEKKTSATATTNGTPPTKEEDSRISFEEWNFLLDAFDRAGVPNLQRREVIAEAAGIPRAHVGTVPLTREQYRRALEYIANYQNGATL
jgi:hypothetical protein